MGVAYVSVGNFHPSYEVSNFGAREFMLIPASKIKILKQVRFIIYPQQFFLMCKYLKHMAMNLRHENKNESTYCNYMEHTEDV